VGLDSMRPWGGSRISVMALALAAGAEPVFAQSFNQMFVFGDSSVDSGYYKILSSPGA
jgi:phospholipase/lecithinase/hemolysin